jgi:hypothetical protein
MHDTILCEAGDHALEKDAQLLPALAHCGTRSAEKRKQPIPQPDPLPTPT